MSYIACEASGLLVNEVLIRRGFPNQFRTLMEGMSPVEWWNVHCGGSQQGKISEAGE